MSPSKAPPPPMPLFPEFKPLGLEDRQFFHDLLWDYQPETSELTFTNLSIWQVHYGYQWSRDRDWLLVTSASPERGGWALPPLGPPPRAEICRTLLTWLAAARGVAAPRIERADRRLVEELAGSPKFAVEPVREHFDYLYRSQDLIQLAGGKYHAKRNYINTLERTYRWRYEPLEDRHLPACRELAAAWCHMKRCEEDLNLMGEWEAVGAALAHLEALQLQGGVILLDGRVEAFSLGELLNRETAVIHVEKANPEIRGLYALINQQFCQNAWAGVSYINREQDLGEPGLRTAKLSYHPHRLVEKFRLRLT
ncbi:MAG TPA: phosphatidylglycerol lysyltransferase domain-containing protein [Desulfobaccales bacterium]